MNKTISKGHLMIIRKFKVVARKGDQLDFTAEGKGRIVDWNTIVGYQSGPLEGINWWVVIQRNGKDIARKMKVTQLSADITGALIKAVAREYSKPTTQTSGPQSGPHNSSKKWPASDNPDVARAGLVDTLEHVGLKVVTEVPKSGPLDIPEFLRR